MRRGMWWALGSTLALTALAQWMPRAPGLVAAIEAPVRAHAQAIEAVSPPASIHALPSQAPLPVELPRQQLEPARRDVFVDAMPAPQAAPPPLPTPATAPQPAAPTPQAPALNLRYVGRMVTPDGMTLVYLGRGDTTVAVAPGDRLDEGFVVESLSNEGVTLVHPALGTRAVVPIPPAPGQ